MARKQSKRRGKRRRSKVVSIEAARVRRLAVSIRGLVEQQSRNLEESVAKILDLYREWEREHPDSRIEPTHRMEMVRFGFTGSAGFERCQDQTRLPWLAFHSFEGREVEEPEPIGDIEISERQMCPAMEHEVCLPIWRAMRLPPCLLLLLEVYQGLGGGGIDTGVEAAVSDFGRWTPEGYEQSFARARRQVRKYEDLEARAAQRRGREADGEGSQKA